MDNIFIVNQKRFLEIEGSPLTSYWIEEKTLDAFKSKKMSDNAISCKGLDTCDNDKFTRLWYEIEKNKIDFIVNDKSFNNKWALYAKGGDYRKWYGNIEYVVLWENNGSVLKNLRDDRGKIKSRPQNIRYYFEKGLTYNSISSKYRAIRILQNAIFGGGGSGLFTSKKEDCYVLAALINSNVSTMLFKILNPGLNFLVGDMLRIPVNDNCYSKNISNFSKHNIDISKEDWDSFETSWNFKKHPLI